MPQVSYAKMPIIDTQTTQVIGYELLLRQYGKQTLADFNQHPKLFIEHHQKLIDTINELDKNKQIRTKGQQLFINLLPEQLCSDQALYAFQKLQTENFPLVIEITEANFSHSVAQAKTNIALLQRQGCSFAIDDFGHLGSNFMRVLNLYPEYIKLDKTFILGNSLDDKQILRLKHLVTFFHKLGSFVIMEGVETEQHCQIAKQINVDFMQGFYFGYPDPI